MEQEFLFIHNNHNEIFSIKLDTISESKFNKHYLKNIKFIIQNNNLNGKFNVVNLFNGIHKKYKTNDIVNATNLDDMIGGSSNFSNSWNTINKYISSTDMTSNNINYGHINDLYKQLVIDGQKINIPNDEINRMFINLLESSKNSD